MVTLPGCFSAISRITRVFPVPQAISITRAPLAHASKHASWHGRSGGSDVGLPCILPDASAEAASWQTWDSPVFVRILCCPRYLRSQLLESGEILQPRRVQSVHSASCQKWELGLTCNGTRRTDYMS